MPTLAQLTLAPWLLEVPQRNWAVTAHGELWTLFTSLVVQDGGLAGAAFNLISLAVLGVAASLAVLALRCGTGRQRWLGLACMLVAAVLLAVGDIHGGAAAIGGVLGGVLANEQPA